jgi:16S rRNA (guanine1207-N2)-methyltransferase
MPLLDTPFAQLDLIRQPEQQNEPLQAFDAADEYLLNHLAAQQPAADTGIGAQRQLRGLGSQPGGQVRSAAAATRSWRSRAWKRTWCATAWHSMRAGSGQ